MLNLAMDSGLLVRERKSLSLGVMDDGRLSAPQWIALTSVHGAALVAPKKLITTKIEGPKLSER